MSLYIDDNIFPFAPFFETLERDGFRFALNDYRRIGVVLSSEANWDRDLLRGVLASLLVREPEQIGIFRRRFDQFFDPDLFVDPAIEKMDHDRALSELCELAGRRTPFVWKGVREWASGSRTAAVDSKPPTSMRRTFVLLAFLVCLAAAHFFQDAWVPRLFDAMFPQPKIVRIGSEVPKPVEKPEELPEEMRSYEGLPRIERVPAAQADRVESWKTWFSVFLALLAASVGWTVFVWNYIRVPKDKPPPADLGRNAPRFFSTGDIGGAPPPFLTSSRLDRLADMLGYFQSERPGKTPNIDASVKKSVRAGGVPELVFEKRRQVHRVLILEDRDARESRAWNPVACELADGLKLRGIPVTYGEFSGAPDKFRTPGGGQRRMEDLDERRSGYLVLIFSDGKRLDLSDTRFVIENLARWPKLAWLDYRETRFWDRRTDFLASRGVPVFPATPSGLDDAFGLLVSEQGGRRTADTGFRAPVRHGAFHASGLDAVVEKICGRTMNWACCCAMMQPLSLGLAHRLREEYFDDLGPEAIGRLFQLPGTRYSPASGLSFSQPVLAVLRREFAVCFGTSRQERILRSIEGLIRERQPSDPGQERKNIAFLNWKYYLERLRLERVPKRALKELARLGADGSPIAGFVKNDLSGVRPCKSSPDPKKTGRGFSPGVPLRVEIRDPKSLQRFGRLVKRAGIPLKKAFPLPKAFRAISFALAISLLASGTMSLMTYMNQGAGTIQYALKADPSGFFPVKIEKRSGQGWEEVPFRKEEKGSRLYDLNEKDGYRINLFRHGREEIEPFGPDLGQETVNLRFDGKMELPCAERIGGSEITVLRCPVGNNQWRKSILTGSPSTWREKLMPDTPRDRLWSIGISLVDAQRGEEYKKKQEELEDLLLYTNSQEELEDLLLYTNSQEELEDLLLYTSSADEIYRVEGNGTDAIDVGGVLDFVEGKLGAWMKNTQVIVFPAYPNILKSDMKKRFEAFARANIAGSRKTPAWSGELASVFQTTLDGITEENREALEKAVTENQLKQVASVEILGKGYPAVFVRSATLSLNGDDLNPVILAKCSHLTELAVSDFPYENLGPLKSLTNLETLAVKGTLFSKVNLKDISAIKRFKKLRIFRFSLNRVSDISALENLTGLQSLDFYFNSVSDISALENLTELQSLDFSFNSVSDISVLENLTGLQYLYFSHNSVSDISTLENLTGLRYLAFYSNSVSDISALENLTGLRYLDFHSNSVSDISALENLTGLQSLDFSSNSVSDISVLENLTGLQSLYFSSNSVSDISALFNHKNLKRIRISQKAIPEGQIEMIKQNNPGLDINFED